jgi:hypothetical protein
MNIFDKRVQKRIKAVWIFIGVLIILSMTILYAAPAWY